MANGVYTIAKQGLIDGTIDMDTNDIRIMLASTTESFSAGDTSMTGPGANRLDTDISLAGRSVTNGVFDATDPVWNAVTGGATIGSAIVYKFISNDAGSTPIIFIELADTSTNGGDITVNFDDGANKIFALTG